MPKSKKPPGKKELLKQCQPWFKQNEVQKIIDALEALPAGERPRDGIAAGFFCYPLSGFIGGDRSKAMLDFRDNLREVGEEAVTFLGGADSLYHGYLDFLAWDPPAVLTAAQAYFEGSGLPYAHFHTFRRDVGGVPLLDEKEPEPDIHEETGSLLLAEDIQALASFSPKGNEVFCSV